jgi:hypothetical protein
LRLAVALLCSCLLHAAMLFHPLLGQQAARQRVSAGNQSLPQALQARLVARNTGQARLRGGERVGAVTVPPPSTRWAGDAAAASDASKGMNLLPFAGAIFFTTDQLTKRPWPIRSPVLDPPQLREFIASGRLVVQLRINSSGWVIEATVLESDLPPIFSDTVSNAFLQSRFMPGQKNGLQVATLMLVEVRYQDKRMSMKLPPRP